MARFAVLVAVGSVFGAGGLSQSIPRPSFDAARQKYPDLGVVGSARNKLFEKEYAARREADPDFFKNPQWPLILADELAVDVSRIQQLAEGGDSQAQVEFGSHLFSGYWVEQDQAAAAQWYRKAAEQGHAAAQCLTGLVHLQVKGGCLRGFLLVAG